MKINVTKKQGVVGMVLTWAGLQLEKFLDYAASVDSIDWSAVGQVAINEIALGAMALIALFVNVDKKQPAEKPVEEPAPKPELKPIKRTNPNAQSEIYNPERVMSSRHFTRKELECRGMTCNCTYPGMSATTMAIMDDLRDHFGVLITMSAFRCKAHNSSIPEASDKSWHMHGGAIDVRPDTDGVTPKMLYDWLNSKYPNKYGIGLYERFVHFDDRPEPFYARKPSPSADWYRRLMPGYNLEN